MEHVSYHSPNVMLHYIFPLPILALSFRCVFYFMNKIDQIAIFVLTYLFYYFYLMTNYLAVQSIERASPDDCQTVTLHANCLDLEWHVACVLIRLSYPRFTLFMASANITACTGVRRHVFCSVRQ